MLNKRSLKRKQKKEAKEGSKRRKQKKEAISNRLHIEKITNGFS